MVSVLGMTNDVKREFPDVDIDPLLFVSKPELEPTGHALIRIWCTLQLVDVGFASLPMVGCPLTHDLIGEPFSMPSSHGTVHGHTVVHL